ncbi:hypothetical protein H5410_001369 [Solanum commersonii]|uniref:Isopentenyltransferase n=1 Tax=Solanum commersonii TaxID=4109 RepID=A0A9J6AYY6_SOLCO|nr:hypothetical protein H5410_001369 [Solanum commersonii]
MILQASISSIKRNTHILICKQLDKIQRLINEKMWSVHHIIATDIFKEDRKEVVDKAWRNTVFKPCLDIVERFLKNDDHNITKMNAFIIINNQFNKKKVVFIMVATGTGKYRLSVDLATHFRGEIINSDKIQVYKGLEIVTNKITHTEKQGVRHYMLGEIEPDSNFTAKDFGLKSIDYIEFFLKTQCVPIIVGGSNSFIEKLVEDPVFMFKHKYDSCFIWIDVEQSVLNHRVDTRVDELVNARLVEEVLQIFIPDANYTKGIRWTIGFLEMAKYLRVEKNIDRDDESKKMILQASISSIKHNTRLLICNQLDKIQRLINEKMWLLHHIIAIDVFKEDRKEVIDKAWRNTFLQPCLDIVERFLKNDDHNITKMNTFIINNKFNKKKVVFIMRATGTGKSRLSVDFVTHFRAEIINSNKMQMYKGLEIITNKITHAEKQGVQHYLLGEIEPNSNFTAEDFCLKSSDYIENFLKTQCVPIIVGG